MPVDRLDEAGRGADERQDRDDFDQDKDVVGAGRLADAAYQHDGENHDDEEGGNVEAEVPAGCVEVFAGEVLQAGGQIGGRDPFKGGMDAEPFEQGLDVRGESDADAHVGEGVFENQIPADDPGHQFAERGVGVGIGRAGDGNHRGEFGVAEAGEDADDSDEDEGQCECRTGAGASGHGGVREQVVDQRGVADFGSVELLSRHGGADDGEDAGADDGANAESGK